MRSSPESAQKVISALEEFGAPLSNLAAEDFTVSDLIVQLGIEPCRIDILTGIGGLGFDEGRENKLAITSDDLEIYVLSKGDFVLQQIAAGRAEDQGDIARLEGAANNDA